MSSNQRDRSSGGSPILVSGDKCCWYARPSTQTLPGSASTPSSFSSFRRRSCGSVTNSYLLPLRGNGSPCACFVINWWSRACIDRKGLANQQKNRKEEAEEREKKKKKPNKTSLGRQIDASAVVLYATATSLGCFGRTYGRTNPLLEMRGRI